MGFKMDWLVRCDVVNKISLLWVFGFFLGSGRVYPIGPSYFKQVKRVVSGSPGYFRVIIVSDSITRLAKWVVFGYRLIM